MEPNSLQGAELSGGEPEFSWDCGGNEVRQVHTTPKAAKSKSVVPWQYKLAF
jgi:hypothetical protein